MQQFIRKLYQYILGDSVIVETDYPGCILERDKIRLYKQSSTAMTRPKYVGEQRVIRVRLLLWWWWYFYPEVQKEVLDSSF